MIHFLVFLSFLSFADQAFTDQRNLLFSPLTTIDGKEDVRYVPLSSEQMSEKRAGVASAHYDKTGAYIYYDQELFAKLSVLSQFIILEHERAHHYLGHTLSTKHHREKNEAVPARLSFIKETDADCASGYALFDKFKGKTRDDVHSAMRSVYLELEGNPREYPDWFRRRLNKVINCFEGALTQRPEPLSFEAT